MNVPHISSNGVVLGHPVTERTVQKIGGERCSQEVLIGHEAVPLHSPAGSPRIPHDHDPLGVVISHGEDGVTAYTVSPWVRQQHLARLRDGVAFEAAIAFGDLVSPLKLSSPWPFVVIDAQD